MNTQEIIDLIKQIEARVDASAGAYQDDTVYLLEETLRPLHHLLFLIDQEKNSNTAVAYCVEHDDAT
jgi:hypothetical protein